MIVLVLVLVSLIFVGFKVIPLLINDYEFQDGMQNIARLASVAHVSPPKIKEAIMKEAVQDGVPITEDDIKISGSQKNVQIDVDYSVTADLGAYQWKLDFHPSVSNAALF